MSLRLISCLLILLFFGCTSSDESDRVGNVIFVVESSSGDPISAQVGTIPETKRSIIDENGKARIDGIPQGVYEFYASHPSLGNGSITRTVFEDKTNEITISLNQSTSFQPQIDLIEPKKKNNTFVYGNPITIKAILTDDKDLTSDLKVNLLSSKEGVLFDGAGPSNDTLEYTSSSFKLGIHNAILTVIDTEGFETIVNFSFTVELDGSIAEIDSIATDQDGVFLRWTYLPFPSLNFYEVYRGYDESNLTKIYQTPLGNSFSFYDDKVDVNQEIFYKVRYVLLNDSYETEIKSIFYKGRSIDIGSGRIEKMIEDPVRPYIYAMDTDNDKLLFINVEDCKVDKSILLENPSDLTINKANTRLYVSANLSFSNWTIIEIDLETKEVIREISISDIEIDPIDIEWLQGDKLAMVKGGYAYVYMMDLNSEEVIFVSSIMLEPLMTTNSLKNILYITEKADNFSLKISRFDVLENSLMLKDESLDPNGENSIPVLSGDEKNLFIAKKRYSTDNFNDSNVLSVYNNILASNYSGSLVAYDGGIFDTDQSVKIKNFDDGAESVITHNSFQEFVTFNSNRGLIIFHPIDN